MMVIEGIGKWNLLRHSSGVVRAYKSQRLMSAKLSDFVCTFLRNILSPEVVTLQEKQLLEIMCVARDKYCQYRGHITRWGFC